MEKQPTSRMCFRDLFRVRRRPAHGAICLHLSFYTDDEGRCVARFRPGPEHGLSRASARGDHLDPAGRPRLTFQGTLTLCRYD